MAYKGLTKHLEVIPGQLTQNTPTTRLPLSELLVVEKNGGQGVKEYEEVAGEMVYPFSAEKCFAVMKDYRRFLLTHLKENERLAKSELGPDCDFHADPVWLYAGDTSGAEGADREKLEGGPLDSVSYGYYRNSVVYWMVDQVLTVDEGGKTDCNGDKIYRFAVQTLDRVCQPKPPVYGHKMYMIFTTFQKDPNKCHLKWIRKWKKPHVLGFFPTSYGWKDYFEAGMERDLFTLWMLYHACYSPRLPKKDSKVLVVGAGPSGLHMSYELIQRGLPAENLTILEKENRYGGKTLSLKDNTNVQVSDPVYSLPPDELEFTVSSIVRHTLHSIIRKATGSDVSHQSAPSAPQEIAARLAGVPSTDASSLVSLPQILHQNSTPNALRHQQTDEYFAHGEEILHELGTCYLSPSYYAIRVLLKQVQEQVVEKAKQEPSEKWKKLVKADITREVCPDTYAIESKDWEGAETLESWIIQSVRELDTKQWILRFFEQSPPDAVINSQVLAAKLKYCKLHCTYMGNFSYTLPARPKDVHLEALNKNLMEFLDDNKLNALVPLFTYALTAQGYGLIEKTPTFLAMQWLNPDLLDGYFEWYVYFNTFKNSVGDVTYPIPEELKRFNTGRKGMLVSGWGALWKCIVELYDFDKRIKLNTDIKSIERKSGEVKVKYVHDGETFNEVYDFLVMGAPLNDAAVSPTVKTFPLDLRQDESNLFLSPDLRACKFKTTLFKPEKNGPYEADHLRIFIDAILANKDGSPVPGNGDVFGVRDSYKAVQTRLCTPDGNKFDPARETAREKMCYQYVAPGNTLKIDDDILRQNYNQFMVDQDGYFDSEVSGSKVSRAESMRKMDKSWTYYTHFEGDALHKGSLWKVLDLQGHHNTLFVHASTNFESVLDIVNYNHMLLDGLTGRLDNMIKPETDSRPDPCERPQVLLFNRILLFETIRYVLNLIIFMFWTIYYVVSYPFAEAYFLKKARLELQAAFMTPDLGSWEDYNMTGFLKVSPATRGYVNYVAGKDNGIPTPVPKNFDPYKPVAGLGYGDTVFKILMAPKNKFTQKYPKIPDSSQIEYSLQWNLTDFREGVKHWLTTFDDTFQPFLTPRIQQIIEGFSYYFPSHYSWFFSWIFAYQFRLLIGYSYRFEDKYGGGLRIPDCHMIRVALKEYGQKMGQRICLTICKIFVEEILSNKGMQIDFQPDYLLGSGTGCTVRMFSPKEHAFSNHSLLEMRKGEEAKAFEKDELAW